MAVSAANKTARTIRMRTYAKLNLFLRVLGTRPDGYHELETILHGIKISDDIEVTSTHSGRLEIHMHFGGGLLGSLPSPEDNVIGEVARHLLAEGAVNDGLEVKVEKNIPIGAGLGGGSGNAAGVLLALNELWGADLPRERILTMAASIGSDVPYCIDGGTALATARGDELAALPAPAVMWFVLGVSHSPLLTKDVYSHWEPSQSAQDVGTAPMTMALGAGDVAEVAALLHNDLEPAIFKLRPDLEKRKDALLRAGALGASVTGSGPTLFGIGRDEAHTQEIAARVENEFDSTIVVSSQSVCVERLD